MGVKSTPADNAPNIAPKLKKAIRDARITPAELARKSGLSTGHVSDLLNGKKGKRPTLDTVLKLCSALGKEPSFFGSINSPM